MDFTLIIPAIIAGILTFLAPCTLPLLPAYLGFISGVAPTDFRNPVIAQSVRRKIFSNGLAFVLGFSALFIILGTGAGFLGNYLLINRLWLTRVGGALIIIFGLLMLGAITLPFFSRTHTLSLPSFFSRGKKINSFLFGAIFAFGWTPCVGPILGAILTLTAVSATATQGAILLGIFSLGLAIPFLIVAYATGSAWRSIGHMHYLLQSISAIGGIFLIFLGILLLTNNFALWVSYFFRVFSFINYNRLLDYL